MCATTSFINMRFRDSSFYVCSAGLPVVLICFFLFYQVRILRLVQSASHVRLEPTHLSLTKKINAIAALETADQVKKL